MRTRRSNWQIVLLALLALTAALPRAAHCESTDIALLIEQSPAQGGTLNLASGLHRFAFNSQVALKAVPQPGYEFSCWLGDVADAVSPQTTVYLNGPKIIVAVFVPTEFDMLAEQYPLAPAGCGGGGLGRAGVIPTALDLSASSFSTPSGGRSRNRSVTDTTAPVHVPEPTSLIVLSLGALALKRKLNSQRY